MVNIVQESIGCLTIPLFMSFLKEVRSRFALVIGIGDRMDTIDITRKEVRSRFVVITRIGDRFINIHFGSV